MLMKQCIANRLLSKYFFFHFSLSLLFPVISVPINNHLVKHFQLYKMSQSLVLVSNKCFFLFALSIKYLTRSISDIIKFFAMEDLSSSSTINCPAVREDFLMVYINICI